MRNLLLGASVIILIFVFITLKANTNVSFKHETSNNQVVETIPVVPISVVVDWFKTPRDAKDFILEYHYKGYIVKSISNSYNSTFIVMEKY